MRYAVRHPRNRALLLLCAAQLLVFLDATVVNVALPTIERGLRFSQESLSWVVNSYLLTFGGLLLSAGRAGDVLGRRRVLTVGVALFTVASLGCAMAGSQATLIAARAAQGVSAAIVSAVGLSLIVTLFEEPGERARATGAFSFVAAGGGSLGVILGAVLTQAAGWRAIFLANVPIGGAIAILVGRLLEPDRAPARGAPIDAPGALLATAAAMLAVLGCVESGSHGWGSLATVAPLAASAVAAAAFVATEARAASPLAPIRLLRAVLAPNLLAVLLRAAMFGWFFFVALYVQRVLGFSALQTGLSFLPATALIGGLSYVVTPRLVSRHGTRLPVVAGAALAGAGLLWLARAPATGTYWPSVLPAMMLVGAGGGLLFMPLVMAATSTVPRSEAGVASGLLSTAQQLGGAVGLAALVGLAGTRTGLLAGYHLAFLASAGASFAAAAAALALLPPGRR